MQVSPGAAGKSSGFGTPLQDQLKRLSSTLCTLHVAGERTRNHQQCCHGRSVDAKTEDGVSITLSDSFYELSGESVVPLETRIIHKLKRSPLMLDLYPWLTYRAATLRRETTIPWRLLELQFGADYKRSRDVQRQISQGALEVVLEHKPVAPQVNLVPKGLHLEPANARPMPTGRKDYALSVKSRSL